MFSGSNRRQWDITSDAASREKKKVPTKERRGY